MATAERTPVAWDISADSVVETVTVSEKSFTEALREKYCFTAAGDARNGFILKINIRGKPKDNTQGKAELGFLRNVVLCNNDITHAGLPEHGLRYLCPNVVDLDLSGNQITSWNDVISLFCQLKQLKYANLARNPLNRDQEALENEMLDFPAVENLVLNGTGVSWPTVAAVCRRLPTVHELHICANGYETISEEAVLHLSHIVCLRMNNNCIKRWREITKLSSLPKLKSLIISENPIEDVFYEKASSQTYPNCQSESDQNSRESCETENRSASADSQNIKVNVSHESMMNTASAVCQNIINEVFENVCLRVHPAGGDAEHVTAPTTPQTMNQNQEEGSEWQVHQGESTTELQPHDQKHTVSGAPDGAIADVSLKDDAPSSSSGSVDRQTYCPENTDEMVNKTVEQNRAVQEASQTVSDHQNFQVSGEAEEGQELSKSLPEHSGNHKAQVSLCQNEESSNITRNLTDGGTMADELQKSKTNVSEQPDEASGEHQKQLKEAGQCRGPEVLQPEANVHPFAELESLCVSNTSISSFDDLRALSQFPKLHSIRIKSKTIFPGVSQEERRKMLIACLPYVSILNGSEVSADERSRSEMDFLQQFKANPNPPVRYEELVAKHGKPIELRTIDLSAGYCEWADITVVADNAPIHNFAVHVVKPIGKLKTHLANKVLFIPTNSFRMYHFACGPYHNEPEVAFDELLLDNLPLSRHNVMHGDEIHIEILDRDDRLVRYALH